MSMTPFPTRRGMTLLEVASALAMLALLSTVLAAAAAESRRHGSLTQNLANLQQFAAGTSSYGAAYQDRWLPPPLSGRPADAIDGHYRWTRGGLKGRDFGAGEIDTSG